jgi:hypothetical protein
MKLRTVLVITPVLVITSISIYIFTANGIDLQLKYTGIENANTDLDFNKDLKESNSLSNTTGMVGNLSLKDNVDLIKQKNNSYTVAAVGDWGCNEDTDRTVANIVDKNPDLVIGLGDYAYSPVADCWFEKIKPFQRIIKIAFGNHENRDGYRDDISMLFSSSNEKEYLEYFGLDNQYYFFDYGNIHFVIMSTEIPFGLGSDQYVKVNNDLRNATKNKKIDWIIVVNHRTTYPAEFFNYGTYHENKRINFDNKIGNEFRQIYHPLFDKYGVDLVLQAHVHNYQRTYPLKYNSINPEIPLITNYNDSDYLNPNGSIFLTVGTGGRSWQNMSPIHKFVYNVFDSTNNVNLGFGIITLDFQKDGSSLRGTFYNNDDPKKPEIGDRFTIKKVG